MRLDRAIRVQTILFLAVIFIGFVFVVAHFAGNRGRDAFTSMGFAEVADGVFTKKVDDGVVAALPKSDAINGLQAGIEYRLFDDAGPQVRAGCSGWLYLGEEVWEVRGGDRNISLHLAIAQKMAADFARRGVGLVMLVVPDKARMVPSDLCGQRVSPQEQGRLARWNQMAIGIPAARVDVVNGWPVHPGYWRTDTHWDRAGARFAAMRTAAAVDVFLKGRGTQHATVTKAAAPQPRPGDLMHLSNLQNSPRWLQPPPDMERAETVTWQSSGGLLDTGPPADVLLAGSSYSTNSGFIDALGLALRREVVQLSEEGGGFDGALFTLMKKHRDTLSHAKVVVWEFPERSLTQPLTGDERAFLRLPH